MANSWKSDGITIPALIMSLFGGAVVFFLLSSLTSCSCPAIRGTLPSRIRHNFAETDDPISASEEDIACVKDQMELNGLRMHENVLRKGINPRNRAQQLQDLARFVPFSLPILQFSPIRFVNCKICQIQRRVSLRGRRIEQPHSAAMPGGVLVERHHSNYVEPWSGRGDVFEFLAESTHLSRDSHVLEMGCGALRVGLHFIHYLSPPHFRCLERDQLSLMAAFRYELPSHGLLHKRPLIVIGEDMDFSRLGPGILYDLIYASAVFLHMPDELVWIGFGRLPS